jgi:hypothetical protein
MSPLQGFRMVGDIIRRLRCATPPVIHNAAASAAILLSQNKNSTDILLIIKFLSYFVLNDVTVYSYIPVKKKCNISPIRGDFNEHLL